MKRAAKPCMSFPNLILLMNSSPSLTIMMLVSQFREPGVCTYPDDFGTGYSNFDRILSLKLDVVKFDRSLLLMTDTDSNSAFILDYFSSAFEKPGYRTI